MTASIEHLFGRIKQALECKNVSGDILPLPPSSAPDEKSLVINCFVESLPLSSDRSELLVHCKRKTNQALAVLHEFVQSWKIEFDIASVSLFQVDGSGEKVRVYWANSRKDSLYSASVDEVENTVTNQGSHLEELNSLLIN